MAMSLSRLDNIRKLAVTTMQIRQVREETHHAAVNGAHA
jgi:hypothetical protein